jgi:hypothetical protein
MHGILVELVRPSRTYEEMIGGPVAVKTKYMIGNIMAEVDV